MHTRGLKRSEMLKVKTKFDCSLSFNPLTPYHHFIPPTPVMLTYFIIILGERIQSRRVITPKA